jgi:hypothetical protein
MFSFLPLAAEAAPAGGAALDQVAGVTLAVTLFTALLVVLGLGHRSGRVAVLARVSGAAGRLSGLPGWAALPLAISGAALLIAAIGMYWDISLHIDQGRDEGPLANPSHYFILVGLYGIFAAGWLAMVLPRPSDPGGAGAGHVAGGGGAPDEIRSPAAVRLPLGRHGLDAPVGGILMLSCASFALMGFPLDDVSHRLFGQDVTLWGPTHLMMLGGAALTLIAVLVLFGEARLAQKAARAAGTHEPVETRTAERLRHARMVGACGGLLAGLSIFQGEFDFGVPQFNMLFHPLLIASAASLALVMARTLIGRGGALAAVGFFLVLRGALALLVGTGFGETVPHFPLYVAEALLIEALALRVRPNGPQAFRFGALAGVLAGTLGVLAAWGWSHVWMPLPWPGHLIPTAIALSLPVAVAGGVLGSFAAGGLQLRAELVGRPRAWAMAGASLLVVAAAVALLLPMSAPTDVRAQLVLRTVSEGSGPDGAGRTVAGTFRFDPPSAVADANWLTVTAWQGGEPMVIDRLRSLGDGVYATTRPIPVSGEWKAMIRFQRGRDVAAIPLALPADAAIPVPAVPALASTVRPFQLDQHVLQRERKQDVPGYLWAFTGLVVLGCTSVLLLVIGWGLVRLARRGRDAHGTGASDSAARRSSGAVRSPATVTTSPPATAHT